MGTCSIGMTLGYMQPGNEAGVHTVWERGWGTHSLGMRLGYTQSGNEARAHARYEARVHEARE